MTIFTSVQVSATRQVNKNQTAGGMMGAWGTYAVTANPVAADTYRMLRLPAGALVTDGIFYSGDLDTNATETLDLDVGWEANGDEIADPDGFGNFGVQGTDTVAGIKAESGYQYLLGGVLITAGPKLFLRETIITVTTVATAATFAAGSLSLVVKYTVA